MTPPPPAVTLDEIRCWPPSIDIVTAGHAWGFSRCHSYRLVRQGQFPVEVIKIGGRYRVRTADLIATLDHDPNRAVA